MSPWYIVKTKLEKTLKKIPFIYRIGHGIRLRKEEGKNTALVDALSKHGMITLRDVQKTLGSSNLRFFFHYGTLLGIIREKGLIPHDNDIDVAILVDRSTFTWEYVDELMKKINFLPSRSFVIEDIVQEKTYTRNGLGVDIFLSDIQGDRMKTMFFYRTTTESYLSRWEHSVALDTSALVRDITKFSLGDFEVNVPSNYEEILASCYGKSWRIPDPSWDDWDNPNYEKLTELKAHRINH